jgi:hypothetical protein
MPVVKVLRILFDRGVCDESGGDHVQWILSSRRSAFEGIDSDAGKALLLIDYDLKECDVPMAGCAQPLSRGGRIPICSAGCWIGGVVEGDL